MKTRMGLETLAGAVLVCLGVLTLALIGAIVAEFFGSPTRGMGFRISTAVGQLALDLVWAEIAVAALAVLGLLSYVIVKAGKYWS